MDKIADVANIPSGQKIYKWTIERKLAQGDFTHVYVCSGQSSSSAYTKFALKCEKADSNLQMLKVEAYVLQKIARRGSRHFCDIEDIGKYHSVHYIVMHLLGRALVDYLKASPTGTFSVNCALSVGIQIFEALEDLHNAGFIHRDLKPSNICMGRFDRGELGKLYLLSFSIARKYLDSKGDMRKARPSVEFRGTVRYASQNCHQLQELSRKDDLESAFYVVVEMITGVLPWKGLPDAETVALTKGACRNVPGINQLLKGACPFEEMKEVMMSIDSLNYMSTPDYQFIYNTIRRAIKRIGIPEHPYDWELGGSNFMPDLV
ncbi:unnamed protein product [Caenorhabditis bovis]|uniref:non-specific serine/threonine protein kinase n=1 Tax=Caenorhabditis bovis TaxID=2654633 RepID=A0A8S1EJW5_9PELO|nr:unnamed protein product [Caenorhabditis bovis]